MVAAGWVYAKGRRHDHDRRRAGSHRGHQRSSAARPVKRYEETYGSRRDVEVYDVDTPGLDRVAPVVVRRGPGDARLRVRHHRSAGRLRRLRPRLPAGAGRPRSTQIYYFTPQDISDGKPVWDVPTQSALLADKGIDPVSGRPYVDILATGVTSGALHPQHRAVRDRARTPSTASATTRWRSTCSTRDMGTRITARRPAGPAGHRVAQQRLPVLEEHRGRSGFDPRDIDRRADGARPRRPLRDHRRTGDDDRERRRQRRLLLAARGRRRHPARRSRQHLEPSAGDSRPPRR